MLKNETVEESIVLLDFEPEFACESVHHDTRSEHQGDAEFLQVSGCPGSTGLRCGSYVRKVQRDRALGPCVCGARHDFSDLSFIPLSSK